MINGQMDARSCSMHVMSFAMSCHVTGWNTMQNKAGQRTQKQDGAQHTFFKKDLWCGQLCSARNRRKIFTETSYALIASGATIHHNMLCQLRLHSSSRYFC